MLFLSSGRLSLDDGGVNGKLLVLKSLWNSSTSGESSTSGCRTREAWSGKTVDSIGTTGRVSEELRGEDEDNRLKGVQTLVGSVGLSIRSAQSKASGRKEVREFPASLVGGLGTYE